MQISATRHSLGVSTTRPAGFRFSSNGSDLNRDTSSTGGLAGGSISRAAGGAAPTLAIPATSTGKPDASTSVCTGPSDAIGTRGSTSRRSGEAASMNTVSETEAPLTLSLVIAIAWAVWDAIRTPPFSTPCHPRLASPVAIKAWRTIAPHNTAKRANRCGLIALPLATQRLHWSQAGQAPAEPHSRSKLCRGQDENRRRSSFSRCVARIQLRPEIKINSLHPPKWTDQWIESPAGTIGASDPAHRTRAFLPFRN